MSTSSLMNTKAEMEIHFSRHKEMEKTDVQMQIIGKKLDQVLNSYKIALNTIDKSLENRISKEIRPYYDNIAALNNYLIEKFFAI